MKFRKILFLILSIFVFFLILILGAFILNNNKTITWQEEDNGFVLNAEYKGSNVWDYTVTGNLPNPCYSTNINSELDENKVLVLLSIIEPAEGVFCSQVIKEVNLSNSFNAGKDAEITFQTNTISTEMPSPNTGLVLDTKFIDGSWAYTISGDKPTPCHDVNVEEIILESFPEQVTLKVSFLDNAKEGIMCMQVLTPFEVSGQLSVSEGATFSLIKISNAETRQ